MLSELNVTDSRDVSARIYMDSDTVMASAVNFHPDINPPINLNHHGNMCLNLLMSDWTHIILLGKIRFAFKALKNGILYPSLLLTILNQTCLGRVLYEQLRTQCCKLVDVMVSF